MEKDIIDKLDNLKSFTRAIFPVVVKKNYVEYSTKYFLTNIEELEDAIKELITQ